jgi:hypothetical protein
MRRMIRHVLPALLLAAAGCADAAQNMQGEEVDARFYAGTSPGPLKHDTGGTSSDIDRSYGYHLESDLIWSSGGLADSGLGLVVGPGVWWRAANGNDAGGGSLTRMDAFGFKGEIGPAYRWREVRFELAPYAGIGWAKERFRTPAGISDSDRGLMTDFGIALTTCLDVSEEAFIQLQIGYDAFRAKCTFTSAGGNVDDTLTGSGLLLLIGFGGRF